MRRPFAGAMALVFLVLSAGRPAGAAVQITTRLAVGPVPIDAVGSQNPTYLTWRTNALAALESGALTGGDTTGPSGFVSGETTFNRQDYFSTEGDFSAAPLPGASPLFPSWRGAANPSGPFATEHGSALWFLFRILGNGQKIALRNLTNVMTSNDPSDFWDQGTGLINNHNYSFGSVGIVYGPSGMPGPDEMVYNNGQSGSLPVDEIDGTGIAIWQPASSSYGGTEQNQIDQSVAAFYAGFPMTKITNTFSLTDSAGNTLAQGTMVASVVPEPATLPLALGWMVIVLSRWRPTRSTRRSAGRGVDAASSPGA